VSKVTATLWPGAIVLTGFLAVLPAPNAMAVSHVAQRLTATSHAPRAHGRAKLALTTASKGRFRVVARGLARGASFDLVVGGVKVGSFTTNAAGSGKVRLSTNPRPSEGLLGVDPRGKSIEVRDDNGDDDLEGDMSDDGDSASGAFVCCLPDDDGTECDVETPDECAAEGGTTHTEIGSCIPNPCGATPPGGEDVVCCFPGSATGAFVDEEAEAGCDETSMHECAMAGGTVVQATSCDPNPCASVPPPQVTVCCVPEDGDSQTDCEIVTPEHCTAAHGTPSDATSCESSPCGGGGNDQGSNEDGDGGSD